MATYIHAYICTQKCEQDSAKVIEALAIWYIQIELDVLSIHVLVMKSGKMLRPQRLHLLQN